MESSIRQHAGGEGAIRTSCSETETERFPAQRDFHLYNDVLKYQTPLSDMENSPEENMKSLKRVSRMKQSVRLSPMASALLQKRKGFYLPPTHFTTPTNQTRILNPACTPALRAHLNQIGPVQVPNGVVADQTLSIHSKLQNKWINGKNFEYGVSLSPVSEPVRSNLSMESPSSAVQDPNASFNRVSKQCPFFPAMHETLTKNLIATNDDKKVASTLQRMRTNFIPRASRGRIHKRALVIGIVYRNSKTSQRHSFNFGGTVEKWYNILVRDFQFLTEEIRILSESFNPGTGKSGVYQPTYDNMKFGLEWLVDGAQAGDCLVFSYSGDVWTKSETANESHPEQHGLIPIDYSSRKACLWDYELHSLIKKLPKGVNLTIFLDCRNPWNLIRLPYIYISFKDKLDGEFEISQSLIPDSWDEKSSLSILISNFRQSRTKRLEKERLNNMKRLKYFEDRVNEFEASGNTVCFAATPMHHRKIARFRKAPNKIFKGEFTDAIERALMELLKAGVPPTFRNVILHMAETLSPPGVRYQVPQVCSTVELALDNAMWI